MVGRGELTALVKVAALRTALNLRRTDQRLRSTVTRP